MGRKITYLKSKELFMIRSSFINGNYAELTVRSKNGKLGTDFEHLAPLIKNDGGHGMLFSDSKNLYFTYHTTNTLGFERPKVCVINDDGDSLSLA